DAHRRHRFDTEGARRGAQSCQIAGTGAAEAEVVPDKHPAGTELRHKYPLDEVDRAQARQASIEAGDVDLRHPTRRELLELPARARQPRRCSVPGKELARVRIEGQDGGRELEILRCLGQALEHRLMTTMHAVEIADGQRQMMLAGASW